MKRANAAAALFFVLAAGAPACSHFEPETGEIVRACADADSDPRPEATVSFKDQIRPIMRSGGANHAPSCGSCHDPNSGGKTGFLQTGLDLTSLGSLRKGGHETGGDIVVPGKPCESDLVNKLRGTYEGARMPKGGPYWTPAEIQLVIDWIAEGAHGDDSE